MLLHIHYQPLFSCAGEVGKYAGLDGEYAGDCGVYRSSDSCRGDEGLYGADVVVVVVAVVSVYEFVLTMDSVCNPGRDADEGGGGGGGGGAGGPLAESNEPETFCGLVGQ